MVEIEYNKLVRDKIPALIAAEGKKAVTDQISDIETFLAYLKKKLFEEVSEFQKSSTLEELADILEVLYTILELQDSSMDELELLRQKKLNERGGFKNRLLLLRVLTP